MIDRLIVALNRVFRPPGVGGRESRKAYADWEYAWGRRVVNEYLEPFGDAAGKHILDVGCGLGGKTAAYAEAGAATVLGVDIAPRNVETARRWCREHGPRGGAGVTFAVADAARLPAPDAAFDTVVANDAMEHFAQPAEALAEMARVTRPGGAIWLFFTPHASPLGSHLYDYVYTPWCHLLFPRRALEGAVRRVLAERAARGEDDGAATPGGLEARCAQIMRSYDEDLNHMTIRRFERIVRRTPGVVRDHLELRPVRFAALRPITRVPLVRELVTGFVVCRLRRREAP